MKGVAVQHGIRRRASRPGARPGRLSAILIVGVLLGGCDLFNDLTPENVAFRMSGAAGASTRAIYSTDFIAGVDTDGVTHVQVFSSDTVFHTLPIDTVMSIERDQRWFVHVETLNHDTLDVSVVVNIDERTLVSKGGGIFPTIPWQYVYVFNEQLTGELDVIF